MKSTGRDCGQSNSKQNIQTLKEKKQKFLVQEP
jgi:hypothetical protein